MTVLRSNTRAILMILLVGLLALAGACNSDDGDTGTNGDDGTTTSSNGGPDISEDAPDPVTVEVDELDILSEWEEAGVPRFRDGEVLDFEPHASQVENGGTLLLDGVNADSDEVIAFYRGALAELGWTERRVGTREMTAENEIASLLVTVNEYEDQTLIMMILTDRLQQSRP
jgi:hypothetical protein